MHKPMTGQSAIWIVTYIIGFISNVAWATYVHSRRIIRQDGISFVRMFQFIFQRFTVECYYYDICYLLRNLMIALLPVLFVNEPQAQVGSMTLVIAAGGLLQSKIAP